MDYNTAKKELISGNTSGADWFKENNYMLEFAYSLVLDKKIKEAEEILNSIYQNDLRADWLKKILPILDGSFQDIFFETKNEDLAKICPTFLQIRNFLEVDLTMLLNADDNEYALNLLNNCAFFYSICKESYKFMGRALYYYGLKKLALRFFLFAKDKFYNDSELHFLLAKLYYDLGEKEKCEHAVKTCLQYIPEYQPALKLLEDVKNI